MTEFAGSLRERVLLETRLESRDGRGVAKARYVYEGVAWAALFPLMPSDLVRGDAISAMPRWQVTMRKREAVGMNTRLTWRGRYLAIRSIVTDPREPAQMVLTCEEQR
ncbi:phage head completion protein [Sphingorhabdus contaminans]|uniref:phage head completion protein n=1 Tax=Sphingorhabdus contaminans TaxID=1343899 RepID=UPI003D2A6992